MANKLSARDLAIQKCQEVNTEYRGVIPRKFYEPLDVTMNEVMGSTTLNPLNISVAPVSLLGGLEYIKIYAVSKQGAYSSNTSVIDIPGNEEENTDHTWAVSAFIIPGKTAIVDPNELSNFIQNNSCDINVANTRTFFGFLMNQGGIVTTIAQGTLLKTTQKQVAKFSSVELKCAGMSLALNREKLSNMAWQTDTNGEGKNLNPLTKIQQQTIDALQSGGAGMLCLQIQRTSEGELNKARIPENFENWQLVAEYSMFDTHSGSMKNLLPGQYGRRRY